MTTLPNHKDKLCVHCWRRPRKGTSLLCEKHFSQWMRWKRNHRDIGAFMEIREPIRISLNNWRRWAESLMIEDSNPL